MSAGGFDFFLGGSDCEIGFVTLLFLKKGFGFNVFFISECALKKPLERGCGFPFTLVLEGGAPRIEFLVGAGEGGLGGLHGIVGAGG